MHYNLIGRGVSAALTPNPRDLAPCPFGIYMGSRLRPPPYHRFRALELNSDNQVSYHYNAECKFLAREYGSVSPIIGGEYFCRTSFSPKRHNNTLENELKEMII